VAGCSSDDGGNGTGGNDTAMGDDTSTGSDTAGGADTATPDDTTTSNDANSDTGSGGGPDGWTVLGACLFTNGSCASYFCDPAAAAVGVEGTLCEQLSAGAAGVPSNCESQTGTFTAGQQCSTADAVGVCSGYPLLDGSSYSLTWYTSSGLAADTAKTICESGGQTFSTP
jgi:hypothetical protein